MLILTTNTTKNEDDIMNMICLYLMQQGWALDVLGDENPIYGPGTNHYSHIDNIYARKGDRLLSICTPHSGNGFKFLLRTDTAATFDRWSNCAYEELLDSVEELAQKISKIT